MGAKLSDQMVATIKDAAAKLRGPDKRAFQAQVTLDYLDGSARRAETVFGWGREAVEKGLRQRQGLVEAITTTANPHETHEARGRRKTEEVLPGLEEDVRSLVNPHSQADPKFQSAFAYTRMTATSVRQALIEPRGYRDEDLPSERTIRRVLNRLGFRLRRVQKTKPVKKVKETDAIFANVRRANREADEDPSCLRISLDSKAKVKVGEFSRSGNILLWIASSNGGTNAKRCTPTSGSWPSTSTAVPRSRAIERSSSSELSSLPMGTIWTSS
jgi:hypothetical protein